MKAFPSNPSSRRGIFGIVGRAWLLATAGGLAFFVLLENDLGRRNPVSITLASVTFLTVIVRTLLSFRENAKITASAHELALTDPLTGLWNRRKLFDDLDHVLGTPVPSEQLLVLYDLNGFKRYNDTFGHPAGDVLLTRLAKKLQRAAGSNAICYRLGGDEFCVLSAVKASKIEALLDATTNALAEESEGFTVTTAFGCAFLPDEAADAVEALRVADQRLYAQKHAALVARGRPHGVLLQALLECEPDLHQHVSSVTTLSLDVGRRLGLDDRALEELELAAGLHDIGKLAIPDAMLLKPGPLDDDEWAFVKRHTIIGQRIVAASPALNHVGQIIRSTHERWDGAGYPDRIAGGEVLLPARIIAVCNAFSAMTTDRPYRKAITADAAVAEIARCAGTQFDPAIVQAFVQTHAHRVVATNVV